MSICKRGRHPLEIRDPIRWFSERVDDDAGIWGGIFDDTGESLSLGANANIRALRRGRTSSGESPSENNLLP